MKTAMQLDAEQENLELHARLDAALRLCTELAARLKRAEIEMAVRPPRPDSAAVREESTALTSAEAAARLQIHPATLFRLLPRYRVPCFVLDGGWRITEQALADWIKQLEITHAPTHQRAPRTVQKLRVASNGTTGPAAQQRGSL